MSLGYWIAVIAGATLSFLVLVIVFVPMERIFPAVREQGFVRNEWWLDLCFFGGQYLFWNAAVTLALAWIFSVLPTILPKTFLIFFASWHWLLQGATVIILSDVLIYWGHRLQHNNSFLWRFHSVHHSTRQLDWLAAHREHPLDTIYTVGLINLPAVLLGFNLAGISALIAFRGIWAIYIHSNVRLNLGPLKYLIGAPEIHHWHHERNRHVGNYANLSPLMDLLFGTFYCPDHEPEQLGVDEPTPKTYLGYLWQPLRFRQRRKTTEDQLVQ